MATQLFCPACKEPIPEGSRAVYCSNACRQRAKRRRQLAIPVDTALVRSRYGLRKLANPAA